MATRKSTRRKAIPHPQLLEASRLLHVTEAAFHTDLGDEPGPQEVRTVIQAAVRSLHQWFDDHAAGAPRSRIYDILSILVLVDGTLSTAVDFPQDKYCEAVRTALGLVRELLTQFMADPLEEPHFLSAGLASLEAQS